MVEDVAFANLVKRRQFIGVDRDAQVIVSYLVIRDKLAATIPNVATLRNPYGSSRPRIKRPLVRILA